MRYLRIRAALVVIIVLAGERLTPSASASDPASQAATEAAYAVHRGDGFAIAAPANWTPARGGTPTSVLFLVGDGRAPVPLMDGTLSALQVGILVEAFPRGGSVKQQVERDLAELKSNKQLVARGEPKIEPLQLSDGTEAMWFETEFDRPERRRLSRYQKIYAADAGGRVFVVTGFIVSSPSGSEFVKRTGLGPFVAAHLRALVLDPEMLDGGQLSAAYAQFSPAAAEGIGRTLQANELLERGSHERSIAAFREALEMCPHISAAHNGLAWALLHAPNADHASVNEALEHAEAAVELTQRRDFAALDTLAIAHKRAGQKEKAVAALKEALALAPHNAELQKRAREFGIEEK